MWTREALAGALIAIAVQAIGSLLLAAAVLAFVVELY